MKLINVTPQAMELVEFTPGPSDSSLALFRERHCAYLVDNADIDVLAKSGLPLRAHRTKNASKGLAAYLVTRNTGIEAIRTAYTHPGRLLGQGIRPLIEIARKRDCPASFLIGVPTPLFLRMRDGQELASTLGEPAAQDESLLLSLLPSVQEPEGLVKEFRGSSQAATLVRRLILIAAGNVRPVLIQGETGTGKEIVARLIDRYGRRRGSFIPVNCGAIPASLFESELLGYEPGAFTGASPKGKIGLWEQARNGTLFLDEIGDLPLECQVKVLRALESDSIFRVGGVCPRRVNARVIASSCQNLFRMVEEGRFREGLFYRLRRFLIRTPPLNAESTSVPGLLQQLWRDLAGAKAPDLDPSVIALLAARRWSGNFRDAKNFLRNLADHFGVLGLKPQHVQALAAYQGPSPRVKRGNVANDFTVSLNRLECLLYLRRTAEALQSARMCLKPLASIRKPIPDENDVGFSNDLLELELLTRDPLSFRNEEVYEAVTGVASKLTLLKGLLTGDQRRVRSFYRSTVLPAMERALKRLFDETASIDNTR